MIAKNFAGRENVRSAGFIDDRTPKPVVVLLELPQALRHGASAELGSAAHDHSRWFAPSMRVDNLNRPHGSFCANSQSNMSASI